MRVLVIESDPRAADPSAAALQGAGHDVVRCFERDLGNFPCNALFEGGACPLDTGPVDVALYVRAHASPSPTPLERGITCAVRAGVPLVQAGVAALSPYERWVTAAVDEGDDVVDACVAAAAAGHHEASIAVMPATSVASALSALEAARSTAALVKDRGVPVGVVTMSALHESPGARPHADATVADVMDWECLRIDPGADVLSTLRVYAAGAWSSLRRRNPCAPYVLEHRAASFDSD